MKIVNTRLTKIFMAIFAPDERLPSSATLSGTYSNIEVLVFYLRVQWSDSLSDKRMGKLKKLHLFLLVPFDWLLMFSILRYTLLLFCLKVHHIVFKIFSLQVQFNGRPNVPLVDKMWLLFQTALKDLFLQSYLYLYLHFHIFLNILGIFQQIEWFSRRLTASFHPEEKRRHLQTR